MSSGTPYEIIQVPDFSGGLDVRTANVELDPNQYQLGYNGEITRRGFKKRAGFEKLTSNAFPSPVIGTENGLRCYLNGVAYTIVVADAGTEKRVYVQTGETWTQITGGTHIEYTDIQLKQYEDYLFICDGTTLQYWDGNGYTKADVVLNPTGAPKYLTSLQPRLMEVADDRLFIVDTRYKNTLFFSEAGVYTTDPGTSMNFRTNDTLPIPDKTEDLNGITALKMYGAREELLVFRQTSIYELLGVDALDYRLNNINTIAGASNQAAICETDESGRGITGADGILFMIAQNQIYAYFSSGILAIGDPVKDYIDGFNMSAASCVYDKKKDQVVMSYPGGTLVWDAQKRKWVSEWSTVFSFAIRFESGNDDDKVIFGQDDSDYVYEMNVGTNDDGEDIEFRVRTKEFTPENFAETKSFRTIYVLADADILEPCTVKLLIDNGTIIDTKPLKMERTGPIIGEITIGDFVIGGGQKQVGIANMGSDLVGRTFSVMIESEDQNELAIYKIGVEAALEPRRRLVRAS